MKAFGYFPHFEDFPAEIISSLDEMTDSKPLSETVARGRVPGTNRWIALFDDGFGFFIFGKEGKAPTLAEIVRAARDAAKKKVSQ